MNKDIGNRIKRIRLLKNIDPKNLADEIGIRHTSLSKIEREGTNSVETLLKIADALEVTPSELFEKPSKANLKESKTEYGNLTKHEFNSKISELEIAILKLTKAVERIEEQLPASTLRQAQGSGTKKAVVKKRTKK